MKPMLLPQTPITKNLLTSDKLYYIQPKYDGIRLTISPTDGIRTRSGKRIPATWLNDALWDTYLRSPWYGMTLDGEILLWNEATRFWKSFNEIQSVVMSKLLGSVEDQASWRYVIFDRIVGQTDYFARWDSLCVHGCLRFEGRMLLTETETGETPDEVDTKARSFVDAGYEGAIIRNPFGWYKHGRATFKSDTIYKYVDWIREEATIVGWEERQTNLDTSCKKQDNLLPAGTLGALVVMSQRFGRFNIGTGFTDEERQSLWNRRDSLKGLTVTFKYRPGHIKDAPCPAVYVGIREEE